MTTPSQPPQGDFPPVHPSGTDQTQFTRPDFLLRFPNFILQLIEKIVGMVVQAITGVFLPGPLGSAFNQLVDWAENILPDMILDPIRQLVEVLIDALDLIPIFGPLAGNVVEYFANIFGLLDDKTTAAQETADQAQNAADNAQQSSNDANASAAVTLATSESTGALIIDQFTGAEAGSLGANWSQGYDSGSGLYGIDGNGNAHWFEAYGGNSMYGYARYSASALTTDVQKAQFVVNSVMPDYYIDPELWLCLRMDSTGFNYVAGIIYNGACEVGYVTSNTYHRLGSVVSVTHAAGDTWAFCAGTSAGNYQLKLLQNGVARCTQTDSSHLSNLGSSYRYSGLRVRAGAQVVGWFTNQRQPPDISVFTAIDYTP